MKTFSIGIIILVILVSAVVLGSIAVWLYRRKINRALAEGQSTAHTSLPAPADTLGGLYKIVILVLVIWVCISMGKLSTIQQEIENLRNSTTVTTYSIDAELENLKNEILKANSRVFNYTSKCSDIDTSDNTCMVKHTVRLKTFSDDTEVFFTFADGREIKMEKTGEGKYEVSLKTDLFKVYNGYSGITIKENGSNYFEELEDEKYNGVENEYWKQYIPSLEGEFGVDVTYSNNNINIRDLIMYSQIKSEYHISSANILFEKNGSVIDTIDAKSSFAEPYGSIVIPVQKDYAVEEKDNMNAKLILTTEEGYTLEQLLFEKNETMYKTYGNSFVIKDKSGKVVFTR